MATDTRLHPDEQVDLAPAGSPSGDSVAGEHATAPLDLEAQSLHSLEYLDHRTRARGISPYLAAPGHYLALQDGDGEELLLPIRERIMHVGRSITADIRFEENQVSRRHAIVVRYGHHVRVLDDRSSNGTFVNGVRIVATDLREDDVIRLGRLAFRYVRTR